MYLPYRFGQDMTKCVLQCTGKSEVQLKTLQPNALDKLSSFLSDLKPIKTGDKLTYILIHSVTKIKYIYLLGTRNIELY